MDQDFANAWMAFSAKVEAEIVRHGYPTFEQGHKEGKWWSIPNSLALSNHELDDPVEVAREIMWWLGDVQAT